MVTSGRDGAGNDYADWEMSDTERIRVTRIGAAAWTGGGPTLRIQKRMASGRLANGPEFPADQVSELRAALDVAAIR